MQQLPDVLYLAIATNPDQTIDGEVLEAYRERLGLLESGFKALHPNTRFQFALYPWNRIEAAMQHRTGAGLGPDLLLVNGMTAIRLLEAGLSDPYPMTPEQAKNFEPAELDRLRDRHGRLAGLPVLLNTQLACFNSTRLRQAPRTMGELLTISAKGHPIGLSLNVYELIWSAGSLGALPALNQAATGQMPSKESLNGLERWLAWLQNANTYQRITFYPDQEATDREFQAGRLDWIPCQSTALNRLRSKLGSALAVAPLPSGEGGEASPLNQLRLFALGKNSSGAGRAQALAFANFSITPLSQRNLSLGSQTVLPANRFVGIPTNSSKTLAAMAVAAKQGQQVNTLTKQLHNNLDRLERTQSVINALVFSTQSPVAGGQELVRIFRGQP